MKKELAIAITLLAGFIILNLAVAVTQQFITAPPYSNAVAAAIEGFAIGTMFAQVVILAIWSGLSPSKTVMRTFLGAAVLVTMAIGTSVFINTFTPRVNFVRQSWGAECYTWLVFVLLYAFLQMLLMFYRRWRGYSLSLDELESPQAKLGTFSLAELVVFPVFFFSSLVNYLRFWLTACVFAVCDRALACFSA